MGPDVPRRTCVGCRRRAPWTALMRLHRGPRGIEVGKGPGRGAWLCADDPVACLDRAVRRSSLPRAFRAPVDATEVCRVRATLELEPVHGLAG